MRSFTRILSSELLKMSKSRLWLILIVSPILACLIGLFANLPKGQLAWPMLIAAMVMLHGLLILPIITGVISSSICRYEHNGGGWKQLLTMPVSRTSVYFAKLSIVAGLLAFCQLLMLGAFLIAGAFHGILGDIPWATLATSLIGGWVACLPLATLQLGVSLGWASFAAPLALNVSLTIPNMLIVNSATYAPFYPWAQPLLAMMPTGQREFGAFNLPLESLMITVVGSLIVFMLVGLISFQRREI
ncbi:ABC transporter permease [Paenibacillus sp. D2_2]|uniref:ABC transporter permease n=1 Tax=Paenibacillus sp. D2_2 TaxID=3073092 RepID=UPI002815C2BD|nr:ABC transporter permease [Paenibacillus sp. D2_2]WMT41151.1 ABC transporter permease [Paenibacillus sp. D2_2]